MATIAQLDKSVDTTLADGYGTITIRVVVLEKTMAAAPAPTAVDSAPADTEPDEVFPDTDKRPTSTFLEEPKRGRQCCVFLINGQRQHAWDNQFIVRDLEFKYLRNRTIVVVDCDGLKPHAIAHLMQGSRFQFFEGTVYSALEARVIATLKGDPDLRRLEEEAEDDISSLEAGDEAVKAALDQLIEAHHEVAAHTTHGHFQGGSESRDESSHGDLLQTQDVVQSSDTPTGQLASEPVLIMKPDLAILRLKPDESRRVTILSNPEDAWKDLKSMSLTFDPPIKELQVTRTSQLRGEAVSLTFVEPDDFEEDEYPIETTVRSTAMFGAAAEPRILEKRVIITKGKKKPPRPPIPLKDDPTFIKVTSRQPIKILVGGPDVHVKMRWDGKDELLEGNPPEWAFQVSCEAPTVEPPTFITRATDGRFELLIQATAGLKAGEQLKFDVDAVGPGKTISTAFLADVVEAPSPRKVQAKVAGGGQRRPPYDLRYVRKADWAEETCWGREWSGDDPGSFESPSLKSPLTIFINQDMDLLASYREMLIAKKNAETTIQQRINKYTAHVAFHLYQMFQRKNNVKRDDDESEGPSEEQMREEIQRVSRTLLKLMEVSQ
jgi:hypothetical protein